MTTRRDAMARSLLLGLKECGANTEHVAFLRAVNVPELRDYSASQQWRFEQGFAPYADGLRQAGYAVHPLLLDISPSSLDTALVLASRFTEENKQLLARAWDALKTGGWLVAALHNDLGAKRLDGLVKELGGEATTLSKHHCRAVALCKTSPTPAPAAWRNATVPQPVPGTPLLSAPGLFSWKNVDAGSRLLAEHLPPLSGHGADIAAGWGYLSWHVLQHHPSIRRITLYEAEWQALQLAQRNVTERAEFHWCDAARPLPGIPAGGFDWAVMNPPVHDALEEAPAMTAAIFSRAADALKQGGSLWLVANRQLPYEKTLESRFAQVRKVRETNDYKIIEAVT